MKNRHLVTVTACAALLLGACAHRGVQLSIQALRRRGPVLKESHSESEAIYVIRENPRIVKYKIIDKTQGSYDQASMEAIASIDPVRHTCWAGSVALDCAKLEVDPDLREYITWNTEAKASVPPEATPPVTPSPAEAPAAQGL